MGGVITEGVGARGVTGRGHISPAHVIVCR